MTLVKRKRAILYCRVSSDEQKNNTSLASQEAFTREYCESNNIIVDKVFLEDHSAKTFDRPTWKEVIKYLKANHKYIDYLFFYDYTRYSRNTAEGFEVHDYLMKKLNVYPQSLTQWIDYNIPEYVYQLGIYLSGPQVDNEWRSRKTKLGMISRMKEGKFVSGRLPDGYIRLNGSGEVLHGKKAEYIRTAFEMIFNGMSIAQVAHRFKAMGYDRRIQSWSQALRNQYYKGIIINSLLDAPVVATNMTPIITTSLFDAVQEILNGKSITKPRLGTEYPLKGFCTCGSCGYPLTGYQVSKKQRKSGGYRDKRTIMYYYICNSKECRTNYSLINMHADFNDLLSTYTIDKDLLPIYIAQLEQTFSQLTATTRQSNTQTRKRLTEINKRIKSLNYKFIDGQIEAEQYQEMKQDLMTDQQTCTSLLNPEFEVSNPSELAKEAAHFLADIEDIWNESTFQYKSQLQRVLFPAGISYSKENRVYRTPQINSVIELISANKAFKTKKAESSKNEKLGLVIDGSP